MGIGFRRRDKVPSPVLVSAAPSRSDQVAGASPQTPRGKEVKMQGLSCRFTAASEDVVDTFFAHDFGALPIHSVIQSSDRLFVSDRCHWGNFNTSWFVQRQVLEVNVLDLCFC